LQMIEQIAPQVILHQMAQFASKVNEAENQR
jgi:hypothetical protein